MVAAFVLVMLIFVNVIISASAENQAELGTLGRVFINLILLFPAIIVFLMSYCRLPSYLIYEEDENPPHREK